jgi:hypothetical protein
MPVQPGCRLDEQTDKIPLRVMTLTTLALMAAEYLKVFRDRRDDKVNYVK